MRTLQFYSEKIGGSVSHIYYLAFQLPASLTPIVVNSSNWEKERVLFQLDVIHVEQQSILSQILIRNYGREGGVRTV